MKLTATLVWMGLLLAVIPVAGQNLGTVTGDESDLYAQTKQVNQFFRRFNNEEDRFGNRYYPGDSLYRDNAFRKVYLNMLFDKESPFIQNSLKEEFINQVSDPDHPIFQKFSGYDQEGGLVYQDVTKKDITVYVKRKETQIAGKLIGFWDVLLGDIRVKETRKEK